MQKKYQIFVSSTFRDLVDERQDAIRNILDLGHILAGMELFPASDNEQLDYIKKIIDECDYYLLIIGGRYGSMDSEGVSFTDREYEYAVDSKKPVLAFIHGNPEELSVENSDIDPRIAARLGEFKERVSKGRLVKFWTTKESLALAVLKTLAKEIQENPQVGWIRGDAAAGEDLLQKINELRNQNEKLKSDLASMANSLKPKIEGAAGLDEKFVVEHRESHTTRHGTEYRNKKNSLTWGEIFSAVGPELLSPKTPSSIDHSIRTYLRQQKGASGSITITDDSLSTIKIHLMALNLISVYKAKAVSGGVTEFIEITELGRSKLLNLKSVRSSSTE